MLLLPERVVDSPEMIGAWPVNSVQQVDALDLLRGLPAGSVDAIITDLPYGTTACSWDEIIPFEPMWAGVKRVLKPRGVFVTTASQPFTSKLINSNFEIFKYCWYWKKSRPSGFVHAPNMPMREIEEIAVFSYAPIGHKGLLGDNRMVYYPQGLVRINRINRQNRETRAAKYTGLRPSHKSELLQEYTNYPSNLLVFSSETGFHPTQKPVALYDYLIRTYTQPGELVLDFCCGSGTTAVAAQKINRRFIAGDQSAEYVAIARKRLAEPYTLDFMTILEQQEVG